MVYVTRSLHLYAVPTAVIEREERALREEHSAMMASYRRALEAQQVPHRDNLIDITERLATRREQEENERLAAIIKRFDPTVVFIPR